MCKMDLLFFFSSSSPLSSSVSFPIWNVCLFDRYIYMLFTHYLICFECFSFSSFFHSFFYCQFSRAFCLRLRRSNPIKWFGLQLTTAINITIYCIVCVCVCVCAHTNVSQLNCECVYLFMCYVARTWLLYSCAHSLHTHTLTSIWKKKTNKNKTG